jgi:hypothetical protein
MKYIELRVLCPGDQFEKWHEIIIAELVLQGFEGFTESGNMLFGYIPANHFSKGKYQILAPFHTADPSIPLHILIEPKMASGTGHHETTRLMPEAILEQPLKGKQVLDTGCGTGILSILASKMCAARIIEQRAKDNDLKLLMHRERKNWIIACFKKSLVG